VTKAGLELEDMEFV
jgi:succinate dehydrogenase/fumarate reductase flavoprotein subunit